MSKVSLNKMGYTLKINRSGEKGAKNWMRVGHLFHTQHLALEYKKKHFPDVAKFTITGVNVTLKALVPTEKK